MMRNGEVVALLAKIVDDILISGELSLVDSIIEKINSRFTLGTVVHGPNRMRYFGLNIIQDEDYNITVDGDDKLNVLETYPLSRCRRKQVDENVNEIERKSFASINASVGWLGVTASPFCALFSSYMQQLAPKACVRHLLYQTNHLRNLKKLGTTVKYCHRPSTLPNEKVSVLVFSDAGRTCDYGQLCFIAGLLFGDISEGSIFHVVSWSSRKSTRPVRSVGAAEILAAGEAIDEGKTIAHAYSILLGQHVDLIIAVDSKDLFQSLSTQRNSIDKSIRADVNVIRHEFEVRNISSMIWLPGKLNFADIGTKMDSPLTLSTQLMFFTGRLPYSFPGIESCNSNRPLG